MTDLKLIQTNSGGDLVLRGNDLATVTGVENTLYLAMFGGDKWVGNFMTDKPYEGRTEKTLLEVALNSAGRQAILNAVNADIAFLSDIPGTTWVADVTFVGINRVKIDIGVNGENFSFLWNPQEESSVRVFTGLCPVVTGLSVSGVTASTLTFGWDASTAIGYQYAYNTSGSTPAEEDWIDTSATEITITGLTDSTLYYVFVRNVCAEGFYSAAVSASDTTDVETPVLPLGIDPILAVFSTVGVTRSGDDVTLWADQSPEGNDMLPVINSPTFEPAIFGSKPGIRFDRLPASQVMETAAAMVGLSGLPAATIFVVATTPDPSGAFPLVYYSTSVGSLLAGMLETYIQMPALTPELNVLAKGNVGVQVGTMPSASDTGVIYTVDLDFSKSATAELKVYKDNSATGYVQGTTSENTGNLASAPFGIGATDGHVGAVVVYPTSLSNSDRTAVYDYLTSYFGL